MVTSQYNGLDEPARRLFVANVARALVGRDAGLESTLDEILARIGWRFIDGALIPVGVIDEQDLVQVPDIARADLTKAAARITTDPSGAITAAAGAIDTVTAHIYRNRGIGDPGDASFQQRVNRSLEAISAMARYKTELMGLGWDAALAELLIHNLEGSSSQAAFVMQSLRANMGDPPIPCR